MTITESEPPRTAEQRKRDVLRRLSRDNDVWVATASRDGQPCMVPLSFTFHDGALILCTRRTTPTARNLLSGDGQVTLGVGLTRDVVLIRAVAEAVGADGLSAAEGESFAARTGFDPRGRADWVFFRCRPRTLRAWREENELAGRLLMRDGVWLV
ncbi:MULTISPECIES: pyridoxamine 5'-phosphate oxidase family protein [unclassified Streptomyces]|uniref:pyridoxamine 5'-phosphate oxidase family protein n=1 Tax=unclassified Streptomyces TaxID=2593676 RepID=UPI0022B72D1F|nr:MULTISPECIES: pyridoxamine 5'-phosphate oxidase family protein [unclassified Streptomyces]MCZ7414180.1 pyridoxamine 5'-phosphate oxidase family protein [Streptomyces sp. WMMC897]MCZ7431198.1 pyridoxamine 5'-phosphate oxidase family protein [Streptomyces sp. WMMC1477]